MKRLLGKTVKILFGTGADLLGTVLGGTHGYWSIRTAHGIYRKRRQQIEIEADTVQDPRDSDARSINSSNSGSEHESESESDESRESNQSESVLEEDLLVSEYESDSEIESEEDESTQEAAQILIGMDAQQQHTATTTTLTSSRPQIPLQAFVQFPPPPPPPLPTTVFPLLAHPQNTLLASQLQWAQRQWLQWYFQFGQPMYH